MSKEDSLTSITVRRSVLWQLRQRQLDMQRQQGPGRITLGEVINRLLAATTQAGTRDSGGA